MSQNLWEQYQNLKKHRNSTIKQTQAKLRSMQHTTNLHLNELKVIGEYEPTDVIQYLQNTMMREFRGEKGKEKEKSNSRKSLEIGGEGNGVGGKLGAFYRSPARSKEESQKNIQSYQSIESHLSKQTRQVPEKDQLSYSRANMHTKSHSNLKPKHEHELKLNDPSNNKKHKIYKYPPISSTKNLHSEHSLQL